MLETVLIYYISTMILQLSLVYFYKKLSKKDINLNVLVFLLLIIMPLIQAIGKIMKFDVWIPFFSVVYFIILFMMIFHSKIRESIIYSIIIWTYITLLDIIMMLLMNCINITEYSGIYIELLKGISSIILSLVVILTSRFSKMTNLLNGIYRRAERVKVKNLNLIFIFLLFIIIEYLSFSHMDNRYIIISALISGIIVLTLIIKFISLNYQIITLKTTNEILEKNEESNLKAMSQYRIMKHNLNYDLGSVKSIANKKARIMIDELIHKYNTNAYVKYDITSMPIGINGFVLERLYPYSDDDIQVSIDNKVKHRILSILGTKNYALFCEALGVTLDNALESTVKTKEKLLYIEFKETKDSLKIKIMNTFSGDIELDKLGTYEYTSKNTGHGLGLYSLLNRKNLYITTSIKNNLFINVIEVKKQKNESK